MIKQDSRGIKMSVKDVKNKKINIENENCNSFVIMKKEINEYTKLLKNKEIVKIEYNIKITFR